MSTHSLLFAFIYVYGCTQNCIVKMLHARALKRFCGNNAMSRVNKAKYMVQEKYITIKFRALY